MKIKVGDLAKIYDLTNQSLHYYENRNLISSTRDIINNYRVYDCDDLSRLGIIKKYRNAGVTIDTITRIMKETDNIDEIQDLYLQQIESARQQIRHYTHLIRILDDLNHKIELCRNHSVQVEEMDFYRVDAGDTQILFQNNRNKEFFRSWFKNILFTCSCYQLFLNNGQLDHFHYGMACENSYRDVVTLDERVQQHQGKYLVFYFIDSDPQSLQEQIRYALEYASENRISLKEEYFYEILQSVTGEKQLIKYCRLLFRITC